MRIAVWHNLPSGGGKRALYSQVSQLIARGHYVECWCPATADPNYLPLSNLTSEHRLPFQPKQILPETRWVRLTAPLRLPHDPLLEEMDRHSQFCTKEILKANFDLIFVAPCVYYRVPRLIRFLGERSAPAILYLQEPQRHLYEAQPELPWIAPRASSAGARLSPRKRWHAFRDDYLKIAALRTAARRELEDAKKYDRILVNSFFSRESIARVYGLDARVSYLGYDPGIFYYTRSVREKFVVGLGSLDYIKGVDTAIEALASMPKQRRLPLVWVANSGNPEYACGMEALAESRGVSLTIKRRITDRELAALLNRTELLLYTSRLEPFGYAPIEANACGAPVVAIAEGGVREVVIDGVTGILCDRDTEQLSAAIEKLIKDSALARELGENGARIAPERWSSKTATDTLLSHFENARARFPDRITAQVRTKDNQPATNSEPKEYASATFPRHYSRRH